MIIGNEIIMAQKDIIKCSECDVEHDQAIKSYTCRKFADSPRFKQRIFDKNGKKFCVNCLVSKYNIDCLVCLKPISSKDKISYFQEARWVGDNFIPADTCSFWCADCDPYAKKESDEDYKKRIIEGNTRQGNICKIANCSQKVSYCNGNYCRQHFDKPCQGTYEGKRCDLVIGNDRGDFCERCKNQTETFRQREIRMATENRQENKDNKKENDSGNADKSEILKLPSDNEIKNFTKEQLITLRNQINAELENRKNKNSQTSNHAVSSQKLESKARKLDDILNKSQVHNVSVSNNPNSDNKVPVGGVIGLVSVFFVLVVGVSILIKRKFLKNKLIIKKKS